MQPQLVEANQYLGAGNAQKALEIYLEIARTTPRSPLAYQGIAQSQYQLKKYEEALRASKIALDLDPRLTAPHIILAYIYARNKDSEQSRRQAEIALELAPSQFETLDCYGTILAAENKYEEAVPYLVRAVEIEPSALSAHHNLAIVYQQLGETGKLTQELRTIYRLSPSLNNGIWLLSTLHHRYMIFLVVGMFLVIILAGILRLPVLLLIPALYLVWLFVNVFWEFRNRRWRRGATLLLATLLYAAALGWFYNGMLPPS